MCEGTGSLPAISQANTIDSAIGRVSQFLDSFSELCIILEAIHRAAELADGLYEEEDSLFMPVKIIGVEPHILPTLIV